MMKPLHAWIAMLCVLGFFDPAAAASPLVPEFEQFCLARDLTPTEVETQARAQGYVAPPPQVAGRIPAPFNQANVLWKGMEGGAAFLVVAENVPKTTPYPSKLCGMALTPGAASDASDFERMIGFRPVKTTGRNVYLFDETEGRRIAVPATEADLAEQATGVHVMAGGFYEGGMTIYVIARPLKPTPQAR